MPATGGRVGTGCSGARTSEHWGTTKLVPPWEVGHPGSGPPWEVGQPATLGNAAQEDDAGNVLVM